MSRFWLTHQSWVSKKIWFSPFPIFHHLIDQINPRLDSLFSQFFYSKLTISYLSPHYLWQISDILSLIEHSLRLYWFPYPPSSHPCLNNVNPSWILRFVASPCLLYLSGTLSLSKVLPLDPPRLQWEYHYFQSLPSAIISIFVKQLLDLLHSF